MMFGGIDALRPQYWNETRQLPATGKRSGIDLALTTGLAVAAALGVAILLLRRL